MTRRWKAYEYHYHKSRDVSTARRMEYVGKVENHSSYFYCSDPKCFCTTLVCCPVHHIV